MGKGTFLDFGCWMKDKCLDCNFQNLIRSSAGLKLFVRKHYLSDNCFVQDMDRQTDNLAGCNCFVLDIDRLDSFGSAASFRFAADFDRKASSSAGCSCFVLGIAHWVPFELVDCNYCMDLLDSFDVYILNALRHAQNSLRTFDKKTQHS